MCISFQLSKAEKHKVAPLSKEAADAATDLQKIGLDWRMSELQDSPHNSQMMLGNMLGNPARLHTVTAWYHNICVDIWMISTEIAWNILIMDKKKNK